MWRFLVEEFKVDDMLKLAGSVAGSHQAFEKSRIIVSPQRAQCHAVVAHLPSSTVAGKKIPKLVIDWLLPRIGRPESFIGRFRSKQSLEFTHYNTH